MRETKIESNEYLGPFRHELTVQVGTIQRMHFVASDIGPYWLTTEERELNRTDRPTGKKIRRFRNKRDLQKDLEAKGVTAKGANYELQALCKNKDIPIEEALDDDIEGWEGKAKRMLQRARERGVIDTGTPNKSA